MPTEFVFPSQNTFQLAEYEDAPLASNQIRGETVATLISQGTELAWARGDDFPIRPGYSAVFKVTEVGDEVEDVKVGDLRFCMGPHRSTQQLNARFTLPLPEGMEVSTALIARLMGVSMTTLMTTEARPGDPVIIAGAGPVGICAAHIFKIGGYEVTVVEPDDLRRSQVEMSGIATTRPAMPLDDPAYSKQVRLVVDCSGNEAAILDGCNIVGQKGEVVLVGVPWRQLTEATAHELMQSVFFNFVKLRSGWEWEIPLIASGFVWEELLEGYNNAAHSNFSGFQRALQWLHDGHVKLKGLVHHCTPENPAELYQQIKEQQIKAPFIVLDW